MEIEAGPPCAGFGGVSYPRVPKLRAGIRGKGKDIGKG
jgi:hypothetical protein